MHISEEKWFDLVNLFDIHQAIKYTIWDRLYLQKDIEGYLNDRYLIDAFDEVDKNLEMLDNSSKFIYLIRIRDGIRMMYEDLKIVPFNEITADTLVPEYEIFENSKNWLKANNIPEPEGLNKDYFIRYYNSIYLLQYNVEIELNELIASIPLLSDQSELINSETSNSKQIESKKEFINNYYISGGKNVIANHVESIVFGISDKLTSKTKPYEVVITICKHFKSLIENNGLFKLIYENDKITVKHESVPQKLFFAVSQIFCVANNIYISPETNSGAGCVDFKFSVGFEQKVTVELKYSKSSKLIDGYKLQLDAYNKAEHTDQSIYLVINVDDNLNLTDLLAIYKKEKTKRTNAPDLIIIDSKYKDSASKLKP